MKFIRKNEKKKQKKRVDNEKKKGIISKWIIKTRRT